MADGTCVTELHVAVPGPHEGLQALTASWSASRHPPRVGEQLVLLDMDELAHDELMDVDPASVPLRWTATVTSVRRPR